MSKLPDDEWENEPCGCATAKRLRPGATYKFFCATHIKELLSATLPKLYTQSEIDALTREKAELQEELGIVDQNNDLLLRERDELAAWGARIVKLSGEMARARAEDERRAIERAICQMTPPASLALFMKVVEAAKNAWEKRPLNLSVESWTENAVALGTLHTALAAWERRK